MKFVSVFFAIFVAVQATNFVVPPYEYWSDHDFHVLPDQSYYCYSLPINQNWFSANFYADCLAEFPQNQDENCEAEQTDLNAFIAGYEIKLASARADIELELQNGLSNFQVEIDELHTSYVNKLKEHLGKVLAEDTDEYVSKIDAYKSELDTIRSQAVNKYIQSIADTINRIETFHVQILNRFRSCLETRISKIEEYNSKMQERSQEFVARYRSALEVIVGKRVDFAASVFDKLYGDEPKDENYEVGIANYRNELTIEVNELVGKFESDVDIAISRLIESYRCNYKCFFATGCYSFNQKSESKSNSFPTTPKYSYKMIGVSPFKVDWCGAKYENLRTCTEDEKRCSFNEQAYIDEIDAKVDEYKVELSTKVTEWEGKISDWKNSAEAGLKEKIDEMLPQNFDGDEPTEEEIDAFRQGLLAQAQTWINLTEQALLAQITALEARISSTIENWKTKALDCVSKIVDEFNKCVANKDIKIASYKADLQNKITETRAKLADWLKKAATEHKAKFDQFWVSAFGQTVKDHYHGYVDAKVNKVLDKYDVYWAVWGPQLEENYVCGTKCKVTLKIPSLNLNYKWDFCAPSIDLCKFY